MGPVSQSGGSPTGAVIERGSNSYGDYVRFADGTQICTRTVDHDLASTDIQVWDFPADFSERPAGQFCVDCSGAAQLEAWYDRKGGAVAYDTSLWRTRGAASASVTGTIEVQLTAIGRWF